MPRRLAKMNRLNAKATDTTERFQKIGFQTDAQFNHAARRCKTYDAARMSDMPRRSLFEIALLNLVIATAMDALAWSYEGDGQSSAILCIYCIFNGIFYGQ